MNGKDVECSVSLKFCFLFVLLKSSKGRILVGVEANRKVSGTIAVVEASKR